MHLSGYALITPADPDAASGLCTSRECVPWPTCRHHDAHFTCTCGHLIAASTLSLRACAVIQSCHHSTMLSFNHASLFLAAPLTSTIPPSPTHAMCFLTPPPMPTTSPAWQCQIFQHSQPIGAGVKHITVVLGIHR